MMAPRIDRHLNLVVEVEQADGSTLHVHSMPLSRAVFESNFLLISRTYAAIFSQQLNTWAGPRVAALLLKQTAADMRIEEAGRSLLTEIRRLTNAAVCVDGAWTTIPWQEIADRKLLSEDDLSEVENILVFFILVSAMERRQELQAALGFLSQIWSVRTTSSSITDLIGSLPTSTGTGNTGERETPSSTTS